MYLLYSFTIPRNAIQLKYKNIEKLYTINLVNYIIVIFLYMILYY
ncbi:hypothetical protein SRABI126_05004 [Pedobacter sp. Bi126]|nr:hypothetical protein SRABI126_05004 [Pedobacter sp. Bi126]